ncbi:unnamed protein product, partial [Allacma fusca]
MALASASKSLVVYITRPYVYDGAIFLVSLPRKVKAGSLIVLKDPLETNVWNRPMASYTSYNITHTGPNGCYFRTFLELSQSHYELGAVFFTGLLEMDLEASNTSMGKEFIRRMQEYNYLSPECYQTIFEGDKACFAYSTLVDSFSEQFLVDIYGHGMYYKSLDSHFAGHMGLGVSKFFPGIL